MRKILVLRGGALGDLIVTLPALALLRERWPAARIELTGNATAATLALARGLLDAVHSQHEARWSTLFGGSPLPSEFAAWLAEFDLVLNFWPDADGALARQFPLRPGQRFLSSTAWPSIAPAAAHYAAALAPLGIAAGRHMHPLGDDRKPALQSAPRIAVHPGSGSPRKNWPLDRWAQLCGWLQRDCRAELLVVTGEAETDDARALSRFGNAAHNPPLEELATQLATCRLFIGHDSGIAHLAAACGVPCILLFGPTDPAMWAPPAPWVRVLQSGSELDLIELPDLQREIVTELNLDGPTKKTLSPYCC